MTTANNTVSKEAPPVENQIHDLFSREIRPIQNWNEWLERWQSAKTYEEMLGLLHRGYKVISFDPQKHGDKKYCPNDRDLFYLTIADGWTSSSLLEKPTEHPSWAFRMKRENNNEAEDLSISEIRQLLATKAFEMLCANFFNIGPYIYNGEENWRWITLVSEKKLFTIVQNFFRVETRFSELQVRNIDIGDKDLRHENAKKFLLRLANFMWAWEEDPIREWDSCGVEKERKNLMIRSTISSAMFWMIEVLCCIKELRLLDKHILKLDDNCLMKMKEIAFRSKFCAHSEYVMKERNVMSIEEACLLGSAPAWLFKKHQIMKAEDKRLKKIRKAEQVKELAEQQLKKLQKR
ncbi:MAG: hypothetical protein WCS89_01230 [Candidatus Paceibacterota bacterium]